MMTIEQQMRLSALLGVPVADLTERTEKFMLKAYDFVKANSNGPRDAIILMAFAYLYVVHIAQTDKNEPLVEAAKDILGHAVTIMEMIDEKY